LISNKYPNTFKDLIDVTKGIEFSFMWVYTVGPFTGALLAGFWQHFDEKAMNTLLEPEKQHGAAVDETI